MGCYTSITWASQVTVMVKNLPTNTGGTRDLGVIPGSGRSPREGKGNPLQYSCLEKPMDGGDWIAHQAPLSMGARPEYCSELPIYIYTHI